MNALTPVSQGGAIAAKFRTIAVENDLGAGVHGGFGVMGYRGKVWSTRYKGEERPLMRLDGDGPRASIDVVIVKAPKVVSKIFYAKGYVEGSDAAPDCWSTNGVVPDAGATAKQADSCVACPKNQWGSRITEAGKKGKACSDSKRLAIVPGNPDKEDPACLRNEMLGGPMLLRVPAASLGDLATYGERMKASGYPYQAVLTRISFDHKEAYPKFTFTPLRPLTEAEADVIVELMGSPQVERILAEDAAVDVPALPAPAAPVFAQPLPGQPGAPVTAATPIPPPAPPPAPPVAPPAPPASPVAPTARPPAPQVVSGTPVQMTTTGGAPPPQVTQQVTQAPPGAPPVAPMPNANFEAELDALLQQ